MPVYKEGLKGVIVPTVTSIMHAIRHYEEQGGTANIFINDDGMQLVPEDQATARKVFYELNHIGWCARPAPNDKVPKDDPDYFQRKGQFKKASNMNYCLNFSLRVEEEFQKQMDSYCRQRGVNQQDLSIDEENEIYDQARDEIVQRDNGKTKAGGNCRIGEIILIIDSDTRVVRFSPTKPVILKAC
jgi:hypothetical protein